jgi:hypothetical protein
MKLQKELKYWHVIRSHMTSETPFKNLHKPEGFRSIGYKLWITEWLMGGEKKKKSKNLDTCTINLYFWLSTVTTKIQNTGNIK